jgi:hypothetical protein
MRNYKPERKVNAFSKYVKGTVSRNRISKTFQGHPDQIKITFADGTVKYKRQTRKEVIDTIHEGNKVGRRKK